MGRSTVACWTLALLIIGTSGCTASRSLNPISWFRAGRSKLDQDDKKLNEEKLAKNNLLKPPKATSDNPGKKSDGNAQTKLAKADPAGSKSDAKPNLLEATGIVHNNETLTLIDKELSDATFAERTQLQKELRGLDAASVRAALRMRRLYRQQNQNSLDQQIAQAAAQYSRGTVNPAIANETVNPVVANVKGNRTIGQQQQLPYNFQSRAGMGLAAPWPQTGNLSLAAYPNPTGSGAIGPSFGRGDTSYGAPSAYHSEWQQDRRGMQSRQPATRAFPGNNVVGQPPMAESMRSPALAHPQVNRYASVRRSSNDWSRPGNPNRAPAGRDGAPMYTQPGNTQPSQYQGNRQLPTANRNPVVYADRLPVVGAGHRIANPPGQQSLHAATPVSGLPPNKYEPQAPTGQQFARTLTPQPGLAKEPMSNTFDAPTYHQHDGIQNARWNDELKKLITLAADYAAQSKAGTTDEEQRDYIERQVYLRMLYLMANRQERAFEAIRGIDPADQEFWQQLLWGVSNYFDSAAVPDSRDRAAETIAQLNTAMERLSEKANLKLRNVSFCHAIANFGNFQRFERDVFNSGQRVLIYSEVVNYKSEPTTDGRYRTKLRSTIDIYKAGANGSPIESMKFDPTEDLCNSTRHDYFHSYDFAIPPGLPPGAYIMKLTIEDQLSPKVASTTLNFTVQ